MSATADLGSLATIRRQCGRLPAGQPLLAVNDSLLVQATAGPDPKPPNDLPMSSGRLAIVWRPFHRK